MAEETQNDIYAISTNVDIKDFMSISEDGKHNPCMMKIYTDEYEDLDYLKDITKIRTLRDKVTDSFVSGILLNDNREYSVTDFVTWMYQIVIFVILSNITETLVGPHTPDTMDNLKGKAKETKKSMLPLNYVESVKLIFKGGTTMYIIYNQVMNRLQKKLRELSVDAEQNKDLIANIREVINALETNRDKFSVSDTDMAIDISANTNKRYLQLNYAVSQLVIKSMNIIANDLEYLWTEKKPTCSLSEFAYTMKPEGWDQAFDHAEETSAAELREHKIRDTIILKAIVQDIKKAKERYYTINSRQNVRSIFEIMALDKFQNLPDMDSSSEDLIPGIHGVIRRYLYEGNEFRGTTNPYIAGLFIELIDYYNYYRTHELIKGTEYGYPHIDTIYGNDIEYVREYTMVRQKLLDFSKYSISLMFLKVRTLYSDEKKEAFKINATAALNKLRVSLDNMPVYNAVNDKFYIMDPNVELTPKSILTDSDESMREDFIVHTKENPLFLNELVSCTRTNNNDTNKDGKHNHYISMNTTILDYFSENKLDFNLFRIKLNSRINKIIREVKIRRTVDNPEGKWKKSMTSGKQLTEVYDEIGDLEGFMTPSEVLDITINDKFDTQKYKKGHYYTSIYHVARNKVVPNDRVHTYIITYSTLMHLADLSYILFEQAHFLPWMDSKYAKRINRLLFFTGLYQQELQNTFAGNQLYTIENTLCSTDISDLNLFNMIKLYDNENHTSENNRLLVKAYIKKFLLYESLGKPEYVYDNYVNLPFFKLFLYKKPYVHLADLFNSVLLMHTILYMLPDEQGVDVLTHNYDTIHCLYDRNQILELTRSNFKEYITNIKIIVDNLELLFVNKFDTPLIESMTNS